MAYMMKLLYKRLEIHLLHIHIHTIQFQSAQSRIHCHQHFSMKVKDETILLIVTLNIKHTEFLVSSEAAKQVIFIPFYEF